MQQRNGFTLIEMSVVLVIVAMLISGVFLGQSMIRASQLQTMIGEYDGYVKALKEFQDKFLALPGDMLGTAGLISPTQPVEMWGTDPCGCPCGVATGTKIVGTCNGDGNGSIGNSDANGVLSNSQEWFRAWQQLSDAGFIQGLYTGTMGTTGNPFEAAINVNVPASAVFGAGWTINYFLYPANGSPDTGVLWRDNYGHLLNFGGFVSGNYTYGAVLRPDDALAVDTKIDDGKPGRGIVRAWRTSRLANCTVTDTSQDAQLYSTNNTIQACSLTFLLGF